MKNISILFMLFILIGNNIYSQNQQDTVKLKINGNVYNYEPKVNHIYSAKNKIKMTKSCEGYRVENTKDSFPEDIKEIFSEERIDEISDHAIMLMLYTDKKGKVLEVIFLNHDLSVTEKGDKTSLSLNEIYLLEKAAKKRKIKLRNTCPDIKYYLVVNPIKFWNIK